jgi:DNA-binding NarL/FixJ family response regulator
MQQHPVTGESANGRIIIVDDEMLTGLGYARTLAEAGYDVVGVTDRAREAVLAAELHRPDLMIMDISQRARFDGIRAAREVRRRVGTPILFVATTCDRATMRRAAAVDPVAHLRKPVGEGELVSAVGKATPPRWPQPGKTAVRPPQRGAASAAGR